MLKNYSPPNSNACPKCHSDQAPNTLVCTMCGYNFRVVLYTGVIDEPAPAQHWTQQPLSDTASSAKRFLSTTGGALIALLAFFGLLALLLIAYHLRSAADPSPTISPVEAQLRPFPERAARAESAARTETATAQPSVDPITQPGSLPGYPYPLPAKSEKTEPGPDQLPPPDEMESGNLRVTKIATQYDGNTYVGDIYGTLHNSGQYPAASIYLSFPIFDERNNLLGVAQTSTVNLRLGEIGLSEHLLITSASIASEYRL